jgi:hypothetical protein
MAAFNVAAYSGTLSPASGVSASVVLDPVGDGRFDLTCV